MKKKYKIISRIRFFLFIFTIIIVVTSFMFLTFGEKKVRGSTYIIAYREVEVNKGDTLWTIAKDYLPKDTDVRTLIYEISQFNNMSSLYIYPGDIIKIPIGDIRH